MARPDLSQSGWLRPGEPAVAGGVMHGVLERRRDRRQGRVSRCTCTVHLTIQWPRRLSLACILRTP
jgi:hypothetical protein